MTTDGLIRRKLGTVMVPGTVVLRKTDTGKSQVQVWRGENHERNAQNQADASNRILETDQYTTEPVWFEAKARN